MSGDPHGLAKVIAVAIAACAVLAGCGDSGAEARSPIGVVERVGTLSALNFAAVTDGRGVATVVGTLNNEGETADRLIGVEAEAEVGKILAVMPDGPVELLPDEPVQLAPRQAVTLVSDDLREGFLVGLTLRFEESPDITMQVPIEPQTGPYAEIEVVRPADGDVSPDDMDPNR